MKRFVIQIRHKNLKEKVLAQCAKSEFSAFLDSNHHRNKYSKYKWLAGWDDAKVFSPKANHFAEFSSFLSQRSDWCFGHFSYDLKNQIEDLSSQNIDEIGFASLLFFIPRFVIYENESGAFLESQIPCSEEKFLSTLLETQNQKTSPISLEQQTSKEQYLKNVASLRSELQFGNIYEINYCIEWKAFLEKEKPFFPVEIFKKLNEKTKAPFAAFYKNQNKYLLSASPERYLQKTGNTLRSQPMKGTAARFSEEIKDQISIQNLKESEKERAENVMITDLVRNDLGRTAKIGSVEVEELFGIQTFETVHQMVTTVRSQLAEGYDIADVIRTTFPMGSMTGAPKISAIQLIEKYETFARNLYSGAVGYISPNGDFDFNVVIRSLLYNAENQLLSARVGSAITMHCSAGKEYEECLLKVAGLLACLC